MLLTLLIHSNLAFSNDVVENTEFGGNNEGSYINYFSYPDFIGKYTNESRVMTDNVYHLYCGKITSRRPKNAKKFQFQIPSTDKVQVVDAITLRASLPMADPLYDLERKQNYVFFVPRYLDVFWSAIVAGIYFIPQEGWILYVAGLAPVKSCDDISEIKEELTTQSINVL